MFQSFPTEVVVIAVLGAIGDQLINSAAGCQRDAFQLGEMLPEGRTC